MWNFGSGSYGKDDMKARLKDRPEKYKPSQESEAYVHKWQLTKTVKPGDIEDEFDDLGLDSDEN